jgi:hypothetical protein
MNRKEDEYAEPSAEKQGKKNTDYAVYAFLRHGTGKAAFCPGNRDGCRTAVHIYHSRISQTYGK